MTTVSHTPPSVHPPSPLVPRSWSPDPAALDAAIERAGEALMRLPSRRCTHCGSAEGPFVMEPRYVGGAGYRDSYYCADHTACDAREKGSAA